MEVTYILTKKEIEDRIVTILILSSLKLAESLLSGRSEEEAVAAAQDVKKQALEIFLRKSE